MFLFLGCSTAPYLEKGRCRVYEDGIRYCGVLDKCYSGNNGEKIVSGWEYQGVMTRGVPDGKGEYCSMLCALHFGKANLATKLSMNNDLIKYVGFFNKNSHLFSGQIITKNNKVNVTDHLVENSMELWKERVSPECILSTKIYKKQTN